MRSMSVNRTPSLTGEAFHDHLKAERIDHSATNVESLEALGA
jgi:hypothetical protein